ncbi:winged helix-turn-helix domain-containing protein [uncultured Massilia sp.]|uniref:winged helix-turn-helix domain-containing protein n=1 Tax=uncultured Massilia sp. TaxID=169973 RepID=UPI00258F64D1|nr:winged helix-turn-helix domain-containing protein [uncultured Massilia sp.]
MSVHVLVLDPDPAVQRLLLQNLGAAGYEAACCASAEAALLRFEERLPDLLLLEWDLAGQSGETLLRRLRAQQRTRELPAIMVSARRLEADKVLALESGADDFLSKPFGTRELLARMHALLRRRAPQPRLDAVQLAGLRLDPGTQRASAGARPIALGPLEFRLLAFLMRHPERVFTRSQLLDSVWGSHAVLDERTVDTHVGRLRAALGNQHQDHIETVRGTGYRFAAWPARPRMKWPSAA